MRRITFKIDGEIIPIIVGEDEDAKKKLREYLGVKRLPNGTEPVENHVITPEEMTKPELTITIKSEQQMLEKIEAFIQKQPDMGHGWVHVRDLVKRNIFHMQEVLSKL